MAEPSWMLISAIPSEWRNLFTEHAISGAIPVRAVVSKVGPPTDLAEKWIEEANALAATHSDFGAERQANWFADRRRTTRFYNGKGKLRQLNETDQLHTSGDVEDPPSDIFSDLDFVTSSRSSKWGPINQFGQQVGYILSSIEFDACAALSHGYPISCNQEVGGESEAVAATATQPPKLVRRGPKPKFAWAAFEGEALRVLVVEGGYDQHYKQSDLDDHMAQWCDKYWESSPQRTERIKHINRANELYGKPHR